MVKSTLMVSTYATVVQRVNPIKNRIQPDNYKALIEKLIQLEPNDRPKFWEQLKNLHSAEIYQTEAQTKVK